MWKRQNREARAPMKNPRLYSLIGALSAAAPLVDAPRQPAAVAIRARGCQPALRRSWRPAPPLAVAPSTLNHNAPGVVVVQRVRELIVAQAIGLAIVECGHTLVERLFLGRDAGDRIPVTPD